MLKAFLPRFGFLTTLTGSKAADAVFSSSWFWRITGFRSLKKSGRNSGVRTEAKETFEDY